jgi:hypothetical protein
MTKKKLQITLSCLLCAIFLLGSHKGYLALWKDDRPEPFQIFPVKVETFPESDQKRLTEGIAARSELELSSLLEDFLS